MKIRIWLRHFLDMPENIVVIYNTVLHRFRPEPAATQSNDCIVIWGKTVRNPYRKNSSPEEKEVVFSLPVNVPKGSCMTVVFHPQQLFTMSRWLLLGTDTLQVTDVRVGQETQVPTSCVLAGLAGRAGEGSFLAADVGQIIGFDVRHF
jgi:hypothetical protein